MTRRIPILSFNEGTKPKKQIYNSLVEGVSEAIKEDKNKVRICEIKNSNTYVTVERKDWKSSLGSALEYYIGTEEYEECSKIKNLIDKL
tara:strand:+ start:146 stop:412 length:267 start_codon:yes stop_codon:yes gene_type:complete